MYVITITVNRDILAAVSSLHVWWLNISAKIKLHSNLIYVSHKAHRKLERKNKTALIPSVK